MAPDDAPLPAQAGGRDALFGGAWNNSPEPQPAPRDTSAFGSWDTAPEADLPEVSEDAPVVIASNWEQPAAASAPKAEVLASNWGAPPPQPAQKAEVFASNWGAPPPQPAQKAEVFASNWDAPPAPAAGNRGAPVPVPDEWSEAPAAQAIPRPDDKVPLAQASEFVSWDQAPVVGAEEALPPAEPGDFVVESSSAAELANDFRPAATSHVDGGKLELASSAEFIQAEQLTQTGAAWQSDGRGVALEPEVELEGEIIQGTVVEEEPPADAVDSWGAAVSQPSAPAVTVPPLASAPAPAPAPARLAPPPPNPAPVVVPALSPQPPLQTRVATPIAAFSGPSVPPLPTSASAPVAGPPPTQASAPALAPVGAAPTSASARSLAPVGATPATVPAGPAPTGAALFDRTGPVLSGESAPVRVTGEHRVILHTLEGQVKRGAIRDADLCGPSLLLELPAGGSETISRDRIKALFFMLNPGTRPPAADGAKVRVTFKDGRQVAGFSRDHQSPQAGFFVVPADNRTNTERIFIYRHGLQTVVPE
ncbi:MAG: hypothetical protein AB1938_30075 [Myxococcota bacterium]